MEDALHPEPSDSVKIPLCKNKEARQAHYRINFTLSLINGKIIFTSKSLNELLILINV